MLLTPPASLHRPPARGLLMAVVAWLAAATASAQATPPWDRLDRGPYDVGFKVEQRWDHSRPYRLDVDSTKDEHARPIRMFIWYPARQRPSDRPLAYGDYVYLSDLSALPWKAPTAQREAIVEGLIATHRKPVKFRQMMPRLLAAPTRAVRDAPVAGGRFPLLLFAPGGTTPGYLHAGLCEYLASHGYISVAVPSVPPRAGERWPFDQTGIDLHLRDQELALSHLFAWPSVDRDKLGLLAWSVGGVSHALMQMRNPDVDAVVSLDGATGYAYGKEMVSASVFFDQQGISVPYLHATGLMPGQYEVEKDFSFYHSLATGVRYLLTFEHLAHADFAAKILFERQLLDAESSGPATEGYAALARAVRGFLDAYVRRDTGAEERFLTLVEDPSLNGIVSTEMTGLEPGRRQAAGLGFGAQLNEPATISEDGR